MVQMGHMQEIALRLRKAVEEMKENAGVDPSRDGDDHLLSRAKHLIFSDGMQDLPGKVRSSMRPLGHPYLPGGKKVAASPLPALFLFHRILAICPLLPAALEYFHMGEAFGDEFPR
jgi:hypothetical protein